MENDNNVNGNLNDNSVLDALVLTREQWRSGIIKAVIFTLIAVIIFFVPVTVRGSTDEDDDCNQGENDCLYHAASPLFPGKHQCI